MEALLPPRRNYEPEAALANNRWVRRGRKQEPGSEACLAQPMRGLDEVWRSWHSWQGLPSLALPCQGPTPPQHTTSQVAACLPFLPTANTSPCPSEPANTILQFCVSLKCVLSRKEQCYSCQKTSFMSTNLLPIHP